MEEGFGYDLMYDRNHAKLSDGRVAYFAGHEHLMRIHIEEFNHLLPGNGAQRIEAGGRVRICSDDYQIYNFRFTNLNSALFKVVQVLDSIKEFPVPLRNRKDCEDLISRPVYWREFPAIITDFDGAQGRVRVTADNPEKRFLHEPWEKEYLEQRDVGNGFGDLWEDILSARIHWFRDPERE